MKTFLKDYLEPLAYFIYAILLYCSFRKSRLFRYKVLFYYYLFAATILLEAAIFDEMDNNWNYNLLFLCTVIIYSWYFKSIFEDRIKKNIVTVLLLFNVLLFIYYDIIDKHLSTYNNYVYAIVFITIVIFTLMYFHQLLLNVKEESLLINFDFWLICGYLLYFLGAFFIVLYYVDAPSTSRWYIWTSASIILFLCSIITLRGYLYIANRKKLHNV